MLERQDVQVGPALRRAWLEEAAAALAARLACGGLPKGRRAEARALLLQAFLAVEADAVGLELLRAVDALATVRRPAPVQRARIGFRPRPLALKPGFVERFFVAEEAAEVKLHRIERFLAVTGHADGRFLSIKNVGVKAVDVPDFTLTRG